MSYEIKYIGMDVHKEATVIAVLNESGKLMTESVIETKASSLLQFLHGLGGELHVTWEEGTWAAWLNDLLQPQVQHIVVCNPRRNAFLKEGSMGPAPARSWQLVSSTVPVSPDRLPILCSRFHHRFLDLVLDQPCGQQSQRLRIATVADPFKLVLPLNFNVGHDHSHIIFLCTSIPAILYDITSPPGGSGERAASSLSRVTGYRRSHGGERQRPIIRSTTHAPDQTHRQPQLLH